MMKQSLRRRRKRMRIPPRYVKYVKFYTRVQCTFYICKMYTFNNQPC